MKKLSANTVTGNSSSASRVIFESEAVSKKASPVVKTDKRTNHKSENYKSRLFSCDLDGNTFEYFNQYRRSFAEINNQPQNSSENLPDDSTAFANCSPEEKYIKVIRSLLDENPKLLLRYPQLSNPKYIRNFARRQLAEAKRRGMDAC